MQVIQLRPISFPTLHLLADLLSSKYVKLLTFSLECESYHELETGRVTVLINKSTVGLEK